MGWSLLLCVLTTIFAAPYLLWKASWLWYQNVPPGPPPWPIVGNLLTVAWILRKGSLAHLAENCGPIWTYWIGPRPLIVVSGVELIYDALINQADSFSDRCHLLSTKIESCNFRTVNTSHGPLWRKLRRNLAFEVLNSTRVRSSKPVRDAEFKNLLQRFKEEASNGHGDDAGVVHAMPLVRRTLFNILNTICFGERMDESIVTEMDALMAELFLTVRSALSDHFVFLRPFQRQKRIKEITGRVKQLMNVRLVKIREAMKNGEPVSGRYVETLLQLQEKEGKDQFSDDNIFALCTEVLNSGTDSTAHTIEWILARIAANPEVQRKIVDELKTVVGDKTIEESDIEKLPYLQAVVTETQRIDGPFTFALPHAVSRTGVKLGGYDIPANALILFKIKSVSEDANIWGDPENFRPERFLKEMAGVDLTGTKKMVLIPFGVGKRICPGMNMALLTMSLIVGLLVQTFEWSHPESGEVDFTPGSGALGSMATPFRARIRDRKYSSQI
ncbi:unnamed protein product [Calypogeia fissa]